jgi:hypothetical protein
MKDLKRKHELKSKFIFFIRLSFYLYAFAFASACQNTTEFKKVLTDTQNEFQSNKCPSDQFFDPQTNSCLVFQCKEYVELNGNVHDIPERDFVRGTCYYIKAISAPLAPTQERTLLNILARDHDTDGNGRPKDLGTARLSLKLHDQRALKLVGQDRNLESQIYVDNFILVRMNQDQSIKAYGTRDSSFVLENGPIGYSDIIKYNNVSIPLDSSIEAGVALVKPINITSSFPLEVMSDLNIDALDCGGAQLLQDIFLLIQ